LALNNNLVASRL